MGKSTISMAIFNSFLLVHQRVSHFHRAINQPIILSSWRFRVIPSRWGSFGAWWQQVPSADWAAHTGANGWPMLERVHHRSHMFTRRKSMGFAGFCPRKMSDANWQTSNWREFEAHLGCQGYDIQQSHPEFPSWHFLCCLAMQEVWVLSFTWVMWQLMETVVWSSWAVFNVGW